MEILKTKKQRVVEEIPIRFLKPNPYGVSRMGDRELLNAMAKNISQVGVLEPVLVRKCRENEFQIVSGERRVKAGKIAGLTTIPCICVSVSQRKSALFSVAENFHQKSTDIFDEAQSIAKMIDFYGMTVEDAGVKLGVSGEQIRRKLAVLKLSDEEKDFCRQLNGNDEDIMRFAEINEKNARLEALERIAKGELSWKNVTEITKLLENELKKDNFIRKNSEIFTNIDLFFRTINRAVEILNSAGGHAVLEKISGENKEIFVITVEN